MAQRVEAVREARGGELLIGMFEVFFNSRNFTSFARGCKLLKGENVLFTCCSKSFLYLPTPGYDMKVQGNDISHKLQISRVSKNDEGLYECRVTRANYGEIVEYKAQAWLRVNATARPRRPLPPAKKSSPLHLTDKKPRKSTSPLSQDNMSSDQRVASTSSSHTSSNTAKRYPSSGKHSVKSWFNSAT
uniref:V-set and transmembrane domain containing 2A n=1 Tax=Poecilia latipinna TaxID=48699 RepID=A0A3B3VPA4_9TELE